MSELLTPELRELLALKLEAPATVQPNFFEVSGYPDHEFVLTNWYRFFFDSTEPHGLGTLFLDALRAVHDRKHPDSPIEWRSDSCYARKEVATQEGNGRADLVLEDSLDTPYTAIIIENKLFAGHDYNPFQDYLTTSLAPQNRTIGILLTLRQARDSNTGNFRNIIHKELFDEVRAKLGTVFQMVPNRYMVVLADLIQQLDSYMEKLKDNHSLRIISDYGPQFKKLIELHQDSDRVLRQAIASSFNEAGYTTVTTKETISVSSKEWPNIRAYVLPGKILSDRVSRITVWLYSRDLVKVWSEWADDEWDSLQAKFPVLIGVSKTNGTGKELWILERDYPDAFSSYEELLTLPEKILKEFQTNWHPALFSLHSELTKRISI